MNITCCPIICKKCTNVWIMLFVWFITILGTRSVIVVNTDMQSNKWENCKSNLKQNHKMERSHEKTKKKFSYIEQHCLFKFK